MFLERKEGKINRWLVVSSVGSDLDFLNRLRKNPLSRKEVRGLKKMGDRLRTR